MVIPTAILNQHLTDLQQEVAALGRVFDRFRSYVNRGFANIYGRLEALETRLDSLERRVESLEVRMELLERRMDALEHRMGTIEKRLESIEKTMVTKDDLAQFEVRLMAGIQAALAAH